MFILSLETKFVTSVSSFAIQNAIQILKRDIAKTVGHFDGANQRMIVVDMQSAHSDLLEEQFAIRFPSDNELVIEAKDELGAIYGIMHISERYLGVMPFDFWTDRIYVKQDFIEIPTVRYISTPFRVRFRGWFVNDEVLLNEWNFEGSNKNTWSMVYETLLRCGGNMIIAGTDNGSRIHRAVAAKTGLYISHHHAEPLGAEMFLKIYPNEAPRFHQNRHLFEKVWEDGILEQKGLNVVWGVGFRGQGDKTFWDDDSVHTDEERGRLISDIIRIQCGLVRKHVKNPYFCTNLYGEILELYEKGFIDVDDEIIKIWADSGYGKMVSRRQNNHNPRSIALADKEDKGGNGIYYHASFYDLQASNHITMSPNSPEFLCRELQKVLDLSMDKYWMINCGNIRPHIFLLDMISQMWQDGEIDLNRFTDSFMKRHFPQGHCEVKRLFDEFHRCIINYGAHEDERAGEEFYHHNARYIMAQMVKGETLESCSWLWWAAGKIPFPEQVNWFCEKCSEKLKQWEALYQNSLAFQSALNPHEAQVFHDMFLMQTILHYTGCKGLIMVCDSFKGLMNKDYLYAYMLANGAMNAFGQGYCALRNSEHGQWQGFYRNDCLTDAELTIRYGDTLRKYLRMLGETPRLGEWERALLYDESDSKIALLLHVHSPLSDDELYRRLMEKGDYGEN